MRKMCIYGFPGDSVGKESTWNVGDQGSIPLLEGHDNPLQYSCLENPLRQRSLVGYGSRGHKELGMTEQLSTAYDFIQNLEHSWLFR